MRLDRYAKLTRTHACKWLGALGLLFVGAAQPARATVCADEAIYCYCVDKVQDGGNISESTTGLLNALAVANLAPEGTTHIIRVQKGTYELTGNVDIDFDGSHDHKNFSLLGGYGENCESRDLYSPADTRIVGTTNNHFILGSIDSSNGSEWASFKVEGLSFRSLQYIWFDARQFECDDDAPGPVRVSRNEFKDAGYLAVNSTCTQGPTVLLNQFTRSALVVLYYGEDSPPHVAFNTIVDQCEDDGAVIIGSMKSDAQFHHNVVAHSPDSEVCDPQIEIVGWGDHKPWVFRNNLFKSELAGGGTYLLPNNHGNLIGSTDPGFVDPANDDFRLRETGVVSPAINAGLTLPDMSLPAVGLAGDVSATDFDGNPRPIGGRFDMGAYESSAANALVVTSTSDNGSDGELRWAINEANSLPGDQEIQFDLGDCTTPKIITLTAPLPQITKTLLIDGYSQDGAKKNTHVDAFNATLCVTITGPAAGLPSAFVVPAVAAPSVSLTVQGLAFTSRVSTTAAIDLAGGSDHGVFGNTFGGPSTSSNRGVRVTSPGPVSIGGTEPGQRNVFGEMDALATSTAIELNHPDLAAVVRNNLIGLASNGLDVAPVKYGIRVLAGDKVQVLDNVVSAAEVVAIDLEGTNTIAVKIQGNSLGLQAYGGVPPLPNGVGISIGNASGGHVIGFNDSAFVIPSQANTITNSGGPGVQIRSSAGSGTRVVGNVIHDNGHTEGGLGIDIGAIGQLANDQGDGDGGPNGQQNFPTFSESTAQENGKRLVKGELITTGSGDRSIAYAVAIYRSPSCPDTNNRGGDAVKYLGSAVVSPLQLPPFGGLPGLYDGGFSIELSSIGAPGFLTATATGPDGSTSELGPCFLEPASMIPLTVPDQAFDVTEDATAGTLVGNIETTGEVESFAITSGNDAGIFSMDPEFGILFVAAADLLDAAQTPVHTLGIQITGGSNTADGTVTINVLTTGILCDGFEDAPCPVAQ